MANSSDNVIDFEQRKRELNEKRNRERINPNTEKNSVMGSSEKKAPGGKSYGMGTSKIPQETQHKMNLASARIQSDLAKSGNNSGLKKADQKRLTNAAKTLAKENVKIPLALVKQIDWLMDWMILFPLLFAIFKDILDYVGFSLPGINEVFNLSIGGLLFLILAVLGSSQGKTFRKYIAGLVGVALEEIFGLNFLPIETVTVIVCFAFVLVERLEAAQARKASLQEAGGEEEGGEYQEAV